MSEKGKNTAASVRQRLANVSEQTRADFQQVLSSYAIERFLYRLSVSKHVKDFVLKGATLFTLWEGLVGFACAGDDGLSPRQEAPT